MSYEFGSFWNIVRFLIVQKYKQWRHWDLPLHRDQLFDKIFHVNELPSQGFIEDIV